MNVKFITSTKESLNTVPVVDGQLVFISDQNGCYYDMNSIRRTISGNNILDKLPRRGVVGEIYVIIAGDDSGIYAWDDEITEFVLIANINTDRFTTYQETSDIEKVYLVGLDENVNADDSDVLHYDTNFYIDTTTQTLHVTNVEGKASDAKEADHAKKSEDAKNADNAKKAEVADKMSEDSGASNKPVYITDGVPTAISYEINASVPEDAVFTDTTYSDFLGATEDGDGDSGLVPQPSTENREQFLKGDGTWSDVVLPDMSGAKPEDNLDGTSGLVPAPDKKDFNKFLKGDGTWAAYSPGAGLVLTSLTFGLKETAVNPGTYGQSDSSTVKIPKITVDKYGRITEASEKEVQFSCGGAADFDDVEFSVDLDGHLYIEYEDGSEE